jgi:membrane protease YdiL (CAAX protease family)
MSKRTIVLIQLLMLGTWLILARLPLSFLLRWVNSTHQLDAAQAAALFYFGVLPGAVAIRFIGALSGAPDKTRFRLGFSWRCFSIAWFAAILAGWLIPNLSALFTGAHIGLPHVGLMLAVAVVVAPVLEELFFRSWLQGLLDDVIVTNSPSLVRMSSSILIQSVLFSLWHFNVLNPAGISPVAFGLHFFGGLSLGVLAHRVRSIWPEVVVHALGNLSAAMVV